MYCLIADTIPHVSMLGKIKQNQSKWQSGRSICENLLVFVVDGNSTFSLMNETYNLKKGDVLFIPKNVYYQAYTADFCEYVFFHFDKTFRFIDNKQAEIKNADYNKCCSLSFAQNLTTFENIYIENKINIFNNFSEINIDLTTCIKHMSSRNINKNILIDITFIKILIAISEIITDSFINKTNNIILDKMLVYINNHYSDNITLTTLSEEFFVSKQHIIRLFKKYTNKTVTEYINIVKINYGLHLLLNTQMNVCQVADNLGLTTNYFCRLFKKIYLVSYSEYVKHLYKDNLLT